MRSYTVDSYAGVIGVYNVHDANHLVQRQSLKYPLTYPSPYPAHDQSRPHGIAIDPSGKFMAVLDLGADLIRIFNISEDADNNGEIQEQQIVELSPGASPRHGSFVKLGEMTYFYVLEQDANKLDTFRVEYLPSGSLTFHFVNQVDLLESMRKDIGSRKVQSSEIAVSVRFCLQILRPIKNDRLT